jgi:hypothetical protein
MSKMKIQVHEKQSAYYLWKARKDSILSNLKKAYDFFDNLEMADKNDWGEAGDLGMFTDSVDSLMEVLKESGYMK